MRKEMCGGTFFDPGYFCRIELGRVRVAAAYRSSPGDAGGCRARSGRGSRDAHAAEAAHSESEPGANRIQRHLCGARRAEQESRLRGEQSERDGAVFW